MCDFSLNAVKSRAAKVDDKLTTKNFGTGTRGFASVDDEDTAICLLPGTELAFDAPISTIPSFWGSGVAGTKTYEHTTAIFRQVDKELPCTHHDAIEMPDGQTVKLTCLDEGQKVTVLQLPTTPKTEAEAKEQERVDVVA